MKRKFVSHYSVGNPDGPFDRDIIDPFYSVLRPPKLLGTAAPPSSLKWK